VLPGPCSPETDSLVAKASQTVDLAERTALYAQADEKLSASNVFIPIGSPIRWSLWRGNATGFVINRFGMHPLMPMILRPK
jgi:oligopeptide transport system substrate-binding protein